MQHPQFRHLPSQRFSPQPFAPLTEEAFAPFGLVLEHRGEDRRHPLDLAFDARGDGGELTSWITRIETPLAGGERIDRLERHPFSDQIFVPLNHQRFLVVVCEDDGTMAPDRATVRGFVAGPGQGVVYRRNVWHAGMLVLDAPAQFFVQMTMAAGGGDDVFHPLAEPILLPSFAGWPETAGGAS
ncbi:ureidoglycolate lyase [Aurantimonas sp. 22II-16-19i]|uniref:ureidoglycolate lyase n=1 Tax=Aurantimonas sp. 22II-16-19i TaxID=1317114 RepID=UPI001593E9D9|nr:ureidoglycolate lyase [Aurantimonas sp. 22II-16-19i]